MERAVRVPGANLNDSGRNRPMIIPGTKPAMWAWAAAVTVLSEAVALFTRFGLGVDAAQFNRTAPLVLQLHHMFWSLPLFAVAAAMRPFPRVRRALLGIAIGLVASDLLHHFAVLPIIVGNTGWHWP